MQLYEKYKGRVQFVIVDLDRGRSAAQKDLAKKYFQGKVPHVTILDKTGKAVYDSPGEVQEARLTSILDEALK